MDEFFINYEGKKVYYRNNPSIFINGFSLFKEKFGWIKFDFQNLNFSHVSYFRHKDEGTHKRYDTSYISDAEIIALMEKSEKDGVDHLYEKLKEFEIDVPPLKYEEGIFYDI